MPEFEEQITRLHREYEQGTVYLSVHHPDGADDHDYAPDTTALALFAASMGSIGGYFCVGFP